MAKTRQLRHRFGLIFSVLLVLQTRWAQADRTEGAYFAALTQELRRGGIGRPVIAVDLDRLDHNLAVVGRHLNGRLHLRTTEKSLPSLGLLAYVLQKSGSHRIMAFHIPFLRELITGLPADTDISFGKTIPIAAVAELWQQLSAAERTQVQARVHWLIDSPFTLTAYRDFFRSQNASFHAHVEIDVGLRRGGASTILQFDQLLDAIKAAAPTVTLTGLMGYDGHVAYVPVAAEKKLPAMRQTLAEVEASYRQFHDRLKTHYPTLYATVRTFNGGGSNTYSLYTQTSVVNDVAMGSGLLKPREFDLPTLTEHEPALFIAAPVLKKQFPAQIPFAGVVSTDSRVHGYYIYGGGWSREIIYPQGIQPHKLMSGPPNGNLVSNQSFLYGIAEPPIAPGDFVFCRPEESDEIFLFDQIYLLRGGKLAGTWKPFHSRY